MFNNIGDVVNAGFCIGCAACLSTCHLKPLDVVECEKGFPVPCVPEECDNCGNCLANCPFTDGDSND